MKELQIFTFSTSNQHCFFFLSKPTQSYDKLVTCTIVYRWTNTRRTPHDSNYLINTTVLATTAITSPPLFSRHRPHRCHVRPLILVFWGKERRKCSGKEKVMTKRKSSKKGRRALQATAGSVPTVTSQVQRQMSGKRANID